MLIKWQGAMVGELKSSRELATEYADADPVYVQKTSVRNASSFLAQEVS